eukprot:3963666-Alexandrium_andersonii.AAC.1
MRGEARTLTFGITILNDGSELQVSVRSGQSAALVAGSGGAEKLRGLVQTASGETAPMDIKGH